jgi:hypothetical protein
MESQVTINEKKLPQWVEKPVQDMLDDIFLDLGHALLPVMYLVKNEYSARPDRLKLIAFVEKRLKESEAKVDLKCHCAGCVDYEKITANGTRVHIRKGKPKGRPKKEKNGKKD